MNLKNSFLFIVALIFFSCNTVEEKEEYLIDIEQFNNLSQKKNVKIIDFRKKSEFDKGHVKNAINIWRRDIEDASYPYGGMMAAKIQLETLFSNLGITNNDLLLVYDDKGLCDAARLWWVLQYYNYKNVKLLNGGLKTLESANVTMTLEPTNYPKSSFSLDNGINKSMFASKEQIEVAIKNYSSIIDTRTTDEFLGKYIKKGAFRAGRIPNSKLIDWANAIHYDGDKKLKSTDLLQQIYGNKSYNINDTLFVYCHSGVRSAHTTFVLTQILGFKNVLNYDGSWTEWSYHKDAPIELDSIKTN
jgi:thiosulfate/3-mercaptopyruvate sulfurtransferase